MARSARRSSSAAQGQRLVAGEPGQQDAELVAAEPGRDVGGAQVVAQALGDSGQERVADGVPEAVVDGLEVVEVDHGQAQRLTRGQQLVGRLLEQGPVGQPGERVVGGPVGELLLIVVELGELTVDAVQQPAVLAQRADLPGDDERRQQRGAERDDQHRGAAGLGADLEQQQVGGGDGGVGDQAEQPPLGPADRHARGPAVPVGGERDA
jgi:hypothetical protein